MGLFKKRATDPDEIERLKTEIASMGARLNASEQAKSELDTTVAGLATRLETPTQPSTPKPPPPPAAAAAAGTAELDKLNAKIERLASRVDATPAADTPAVDPAEIEQLNDRIEQLSTRVDATPDAPAIDPTEVEQLSAKIDELSLRVDAAPEQATPAVDPAQIERLDSTMQRISDRIDEIDQRITSISTELANQINELSGDLDAAANPDPRDEELVAELRDAQTRLAGEQARYQIAFRQDLADLADRLKRA